MKPKGRNYAWPELHERLRVAYETMTKQVGAADPKIVSDQREFNRLQDVIYDKKSLIMNLRQEDTMYLYEIFVVYVAEGFKPIVKLPKSPYYCARNEEEAKIASRAVELVDPGWDPEGVTIICNELGQIKVKK